MTSDYAKTLWGIQMTIENCFGRHLINRTNNPANCLISIASIHSSDKFEPYSIDGQHGSLLQPWGVGKGREQLRKEAKVTESIDSN